jgi:hypothetical protein
MYRSIRPAAVHETIEQLVQRIAERFPDSSLHGVALELLNHSKQSEWRTGRVRRPIIALRLVVGVLLLSIIAVAVSLPLQLRVGDVSTLLEVIQIAEPALGMVFFITAFGVFLMSLETRIKRGRALSALHELRSLAHIVDMHQLTKDPAALTPGAERTLSSPERSMSPFELGRYFDYCSELLSLVSKLAALYVEDFPDHIAVGAVDQIETLCTGLSRKIWQKIMILNQLD